MKKAKPCLERKCLLKNPEFLGREKNGRHCYIFNRLKSNFICVLEYYLHGMKYKYYKHKYEK
jgi:hypothetical protein